MQILVFFCVKLKAFDSNNLGENKLQIRICNTNFVQTFKKSDLRGNLLDLIH